MPRDRANIRTDIWGDSDWRQLSFGAQWLYNYVLTHGTLNAVGVADWRPARALGVAAGLSRPILREFVRELTEAFFLVLDENTEEVLVRSFFRHDGILTNPNMLATIKRDFAAVSSPLLLGVIAHEANRLRTEYPDGITKKFNPWDRSELTTLLKSTQVDARAHALSQPAEDMPPTLFEEDTPSGTPSDTPSPRGSGRGSGTTTATTTTTKELVSSTDAEDATLIPSDWAPTQKHRDKAADLHLDVERAAQRFIAHARRTRRRQKSWHLSFSNWLVKDLEFERINGGSVTSAATPAPATRLSAVEQNLVNYANKYPGGNHDEQARDRAAIDSGVGH